MAEKLFEIEAANTPETLGATPRYMLQHNAISRSAHSLSATAKKLTAMAMALLPPDLSSLTAAFTFPEFCKALATPIGGETYKIFQGAVTECLQCVITLETEPDAKGKKEWKKFTWFTVARFSEKTGQATMTFSTELAEFLLELKRVYAKIYLQDLGRLQSRYAIRIFEFAMSFAFLQGKQGNKADEWYFRESVQALRHTMGVSPEAYPETRLFRQKVIEEPVKEINRAGIGFEITTAGVKQGRRLESIEFTCKKSARTTGAKGRSKKKTAPAENPATTAELPTNPLEARFKEDKELEHLRELYPKEFAELYAVEYAKPPLPFNTWNSDRHRDNAVVVACKTLKERHGIVK